MITMSFFVFAPASRALQASIRHESLYLLGCRRTVPRRRPFQKPACTRSYLLSTVCNYWLPITHQRFYNLLLSLARSADWLRSSGGFFPPNIWEPRPFSSSSFSSRLP
ncbi:hypothetical protein BD289DRAFT_424954 [Coniella lustricola]|uniref:Uncharacterized protein n=1 Tax=Coniella lustricola TaxID=2025994 RepID=A0A2T3AHY0_9PEZI|nr:hypothetical protein BD289DRAFT_424954 [Coniella lustricola]